MRFCCNADVAQNFIFRIGKYHELLNNIDGNYFYDPLQNGNLPYVDAVSINYNEAKGSIGYLPINQNDILFFRLSLINASGAKVIFYDENKELLNSYTQAEFLTQFNIDLSANKIIPFVVTNASWKYVAIQAIAYYCSSAAYKSIDNRVIINNTNLSINEKQRIYKEIYDEYFSDFVSQYIPIVPSERKYFNCYGTNTEIVENGKIILDISDANAKYIGATNFRRQGGEKNIINFDISVIEMSGISEDNPLIISKYGSSVINGGEKRISKINNSIHVEVYVVDTATIQFSSTCKVEISNIYISYIISVQ